jgi:DNA polymerase III epsilon subunit-like protein
MNFLARWLGRWGSRAAKGANARWVVVDTETSGLDPETDRLLGIECTIRHNAAADAPATAALQRIARQKKWLQGSGSQ